MFAAESEHGVLEIQIKDHREAIGDFAKLDIVLAAGNSYLSEGHVEFTGERIQPTTVEWVWRLSADNPVLCFSEIWMTAADATHVRIGTAIFGERG